MNTLAVADNVEENTDELTCSAEDESAVSGDDMGDDASTAIGANADTYDCVVAASCVCVPEDDGGDGEGMGEDARRPERRTIRRLIRRNRFGGREAMSTGDGSMGEDLGMDDVMLLLCCVEVVVGAKPEAAESVGVVCVGCGD